MSARTGSRVSRAASTAARQLLLLLLAAAFLTPIIMMLVGAAKPSAQVFGAGWDAFNPKGFTALGANVRAALAGSANLPFLGALRNSLLISSLIVVLGLGVNSLAGYALARIPFRGRKIALALVIALIMVPFEALALPLLLLMAQPVGGHRLSDSILAQVLPFVAQPLYIILFYSFFTGLPSELEEAAQLDGAGLLRTFRSVIVPLSGPAYASSAILTFLYSWGQFLWPVMITAGRPELQPLPLGLLNYLGTTPNWGGFYAYATMMVVPVVVVFLFFQRWFVQGVASTGSKG
jgi:multiple sugar transport system permease protein